MDRHGIANTRYTNNIATTTTTPTRNKMFYFGNNIDKITHDCVIVFNAIRAGVLISYSGAALQYVSILHDTGQ